MRLGMTFAAAFALTTAGFAISAAAQDATAAITAAVADPMRPAADTARDANRKPTRAEIRNCLTHLRSTLDLIDAPVIATLGSVALDALKMIEPHSLTLREDAGTVVKWNERILVPLYHPSPQVIASQRGLDIQLSHFQTLLEVIRRKG